MACYCKHQQETTITIPSNVDINGMNCIEILFVYSQIDSSIFIFSGTTFYNIHISIGNVYWTVRHRYKEFVDLHAKLVNGQSIGRDLLPPKKVRMQQNVM